MIFDSEKFMKSIAQLRKKENLSQSQLATFIDIDYTTYNKYELNHRVPPTKVVLALANYFGASIADCLSDFESLDKISQRKKLLSLLETINDESDLVVLYNVLATIKRVREIERV